MTINPPISKTMKTIDRILKYLSIYSFTFGPTKYNKAPTMKNLSPLPIVEISINGRRGISVAPAAIVVIL